jgi:subtilisin family serine protease
MLGWGQRLMGLNPSDRFCGSGVRIGSIDSGCDNSHPLLRHVTQGKDFTANGTDTSWTQDLVSHGTHCVGIINASSTEQGVVGCAPAAELHVFKVIPGGRISDLLAALDECIERDLDLINISVVSDGFSELVSQKLQEARQKGIACIVAAGNSGGPLSFPATVPGIMAAAAVGKLREFPADSSHVLSVVPQLIGSEDIFAASFSSAGPQVAISAPGVAIVSTVPGGGYAAADGTSAAAAHVTGLAALVLGHHPLFQEGPFTVRSEQRVHALFELIRASAVPRFADPQRGGAGVPDLPRIPSGQSFAMGLSVPDGAERLAIPTYWPASQQGWPATWPPPRAAAAGLF